MKKQTKAPKLTLKKELLANLQHAQGGAVQQSKLNDTVYHPAPTEYQCPSAGCGYA